jgi:hypothetical protein
VISFESFVVKRHFEMHPYTLFSDHFGPPQRSAI